MGLATRAGMITIQLTNDDATFLAEQLIERARHVENELVHTDKRSLQAAIARDLEHLEQLRDRVLRAVEPLKTDAIV